MKTPATILTMLLASLLLASCHSVPQEPNNPRGNFEALWRMIDEHYCFLDEKGLDWDEIYTKYSPKVSNGMTSDELFVVCADMLDELRDGHVNLSSPFNTSYYRKWWSDYPQNFSARLIEESYFNFNYRQSSGMMFGILSDNVGYLRIPSFVNPVGEGNLDNVLYFLRTCTGLVIDVRDNGGGSLTEVETIVQRFISTPTLVGYISHKTGPGHSDFSEPRAVTYRPADEGRIRWGKPVVVLTNRSTFSAANNFVSIMKYLPGVTIAGATTGGGSGMPYSSELPNGWSVRFSACPMLDAKGASTEFGVEPSPGCAVDMDVNDALVGHDTILDFAISYLQNR